MVVIIAPIVEGKLEAWKQWCTELNGARAEGIKDFNRRYGLTRHASWLAETPNGQVVVALHQGPGEDDFMPKLAASDNEFDRWFASKILECHGMDVSQPPPGPMPQLYFDSGS